MGIDAVARLLSVSAQKLMKGAYGIDRRILGGGLKRGRSSIEQFHKAIAGKAMSLLKRVGLNPGYMMTGGVAKNPGVVAVLEEQLGEKLHIYEEPEIVGALGAALYGLEEIL